MSKLVCRQNKVAGMTAISESIQRYGDVIALRLVIAFASRRPTAHTTTLLKIRLCR